jgi:hypothetical protein
MNRFFKQCSFTFLLALLTACASSYTPMLDPGAAIDQQQYAQDLATCKGYAESLSTTEAAAIAGGTAAAGGAVVAKVTDEGNEGGVAAITGALGAALGAADSEQQKITIIQKCLDDRGYKVLN